MDQSDNKYAKSIALLNDALRKEIATSLQYMYFHVRLEDAGYEVDLQFASNDVATQVSQVENMVSGGCDAIVIGSIDGESLGTPLKQAEDAVLVDSSEMDIDEVVEAIRSIYEEKKGC